MVKTPLMIEKGTVSKGTSVYVLPSAIDDHLTAGKKVISFGRIFGTRKLTPKIDNVA